MHGCAAAANPRTCLSAYPRASERAYGAGWESLPGATLRVLRENRYVSTFWTRSSADGRFVAHGTWGESTAAIVDLLEDRAIPADALWDPGFFPDNSAFVFQGTDRGASFCEQSVLTSSPAHITFSEPGCSGTSDVGLYQHVGAALGGGDYWVVDGLFADDDGGHDVTLKDPGADFGGDAQIRLTPMVHTGNQFEPGATIRVDAPYEGDSVISPSSRLLVSRVPGSDGTQIGYTMRRVDATPGPTGYSVQTPEIARYCLRGGKPSFSYDERWMVIHHYVGDEDADDLGFSGPGDPAFATYQAQGSSNIYLVDLLTGAVTRLTKMKPGQYALYPHFRSDGWLYFIVRTLDSATEYMVASDAALLLESAP
jgi:hypothetical protein